jgi:hypothetical protein
VFCSSKEPHPPALRPDRRGINISGVDFWHAVEFSRNGSFLRSRFTGPSGLSLRVLQLIRPFRLRFPLTGFCFSVSTFRLSRFSRLYQSRSGRPNRLSLVRSEFGGLPRNDDTQFHPENSLGMRRAIDFLEEG